MLMGSAYFFKDYYSDYNSHDTDFIELSDDPEIKFCIHLMSFKEPKEDIHIFRRKSKSEMIQDCLKGNLPMAVGKFLIPEFNKEIGFEVQDLLCLKPLIDALDEKHLYEKIIYESYLKNNSFTLTDSQRLKAYECYKKARL